MNKNEGNRWSNVLLTSAGFFDGQNKPRTANIECFSRMLSKPFTEARVLFIPTAALLPEDPNYEYADWCKKNLLLLGVPQKNIMPYDIDSSLTASQAMAFDVIFFTGGNTPYLARRVRETGFEKLIKQMVYANKVYVGISAGSMLAMTNFNVDNLNEHTLLDFAGLGLIDIYFSVHCQPGTPARTDLPKTHIPLTDNQALAVSCMGYELIG